MSEKQPLAEALRTEILKLATEGEKGNGTLTADVLLRIMRVAKTGRELLVSLAASPANLAGMIKRSGFGGVSFGDSSMGGEDLGDGSMTGPMPYAMSPLSENFGMTAIREIIAATKNLNGNGTSPAKLVEALVIARENGLIDVAKELEAQLGIGKPKAALPAPVGVDDGKPKVVKFDTVISAGEGLTKTTVQEEKPS
jgi:hypothetical protein